jgi:hypothetical protein
VGVVDQRTRCIQGDPRRAKSVPEDNPLLVDSVAVSFIGHAIAIGDVAFFAPGFQTLKGSALANHVGQVAGNKEAKLLALA